MPLNMRSLMMYVQKDQSLFNLIIKKNNKIYGYNTDILALLKIINKFNSRVFLS